MGEAPTKEGDLGAKPQLRINAGGDQSVRLVDMPWD